jgi:hypothetical protein
VGGGGGGVDLDRMGEYELWKHLNDVLAQCSNKGGTGEQREPMSCSRAFLHAAPALAGSGSMRRL